MGTSGALIGGNDASPPTGDSLVVCCCLLLSLPLLLLDSWGLLFVDVDDEWTSCEFAAVVVSFDCVDKDELTRLLVLAMVPLFIIRLEPADASWLLLLCATVWEGDGGGIAGPVTATGCTKQIFVRLMDNVVDINWWLFFAR